MLFDFYNKVSGSIYKCDGDNPAITPSHMKGIYISETPIAIENEIQINNVYNEILKQESLGNIIIQKYNKLSLDDKDEILKSTVRAIHMQKLLISSEHVPKQEQACFVQTHFPQSWNIASKMTKAEVNQMIYEWRASLQIDK